MTAAQRLKGRRFENECVGVLVANGIQARRISESGMPGPDIEAFNGRIVEAKIREHLPALLRTGLRDSEIFLTREDRGPIIACMELSTLLDLLDERGIA